MKNSNLFDIIQVPDPVLRAVAQPVARVDDELRVVFDRMHATMNKAEGIGLASNQVARLDRLFVVDLHDGQNKYSMANPEIIWKSEEPFVYNEGCLSIPGYYAEVERPRAIRVTYLDENNAAQELEASDLLSICIQHELDHLNGVLFIDHISRLKRDVILRKLAKDQKMAAKAL